MIEKCTVQSYTSRILGNYIVRSHNTCAYKTYCGVVCRRFEQDAKWGCQVPMWSMNPCCIVYLFQAELFIRSDPISIVDSKIFQRVPRFSANAWSCIIGRKNRQGPTVHLIACYHWKDIWMINTQVARCFSIELLSSKLSNLVVISDIWSFTAALLWILSSV